MNEFPKEITIRIRMIDYTNKAIYVKWVDSYGVTTGWQSIDGFEHCPLLIHSFGVVIYQDDNVISLAHNYAKETPNTIEQANGIMTIPLACIQDISEINSYNSFN
jgi:hypothetical protein